MVLFKYTLENTVICTKISPIIINQMALVPDNETGLSENEIHFARNTFLRDCPNGRCSKRKFLTFIRKSSFSAQSNLFSIKTFQNHRQSKKFFSMMFDIYDQNRDGELDFDEYLYALSAITGANRLRTIETLFRFFDTNQQGYITREEFDSRKKLAAQFLGQCKTGINDSLSSELAFNTMDIDKDGRISKEEFIQWHLQDHLTSQETKPMKKRTRLLRNLSTLVESRGQIKTSSLQKKNSVDAWLETTMNIHNNQELSSTINADRYLLKIFRRARNRFHHAKSKSDRTSTDLQSDSGVFTSSSMTNFTDHDLDSNSFVDLDENDFQLIPTDDADSELLCESLEAVLMETLLELRQQRLTGNYPNTVGKEDKQSLATRL